MDMNTKNSNKSKKCLTNFSMSLLTSLILKNLLKKYCIGKFKHFFIHGKTLNLHIATINLKSLPQLGLRNLNYPTDHIIFQTFKVILDLL